jgi:hypothetical protein
MKRISLLTINNLLYNGNDKQKKIIVDKLLCELWQSDKAQAFIDKHNAKGEQVISLQKECYNLVALNANIKVKGE